MRCYLLFLALFVAACQPLISSPLNPDGETSVPPLPTLAPNLISLGETVYVQQCASCHGVSLEGQPDWKMQNEDRSFRAPPHDATGHTWHHGDLTLLAAVRSGGARFADMNIGGSSNMPAYVEILTDEEITAVLSYIKSTWPEDIRLFQWEATLREQTQQTR